MIIGIAIVLLGILFLIEVFNPGFKLDFGIVWPTVLLIVTAYYMIKDKKCSFASGFLLFFGVWFLLVNLDLILYPYTRAFWPLVLIIIGAYVILTALDGRDMVKEMHKNRGDGAFKKYIGVFSGVEEKVKTDDFKGADLYCVFGGVDLDLRDIELKEDAIINVYSVFGGGTLLVSDQYNLVCNSTALFGGNDNKANNTYKKTKKTLTINCISFFGGTEIK